MQRLYLHALVAELLATLEADGQPFGTGQHLRIGELLQNLPEDTQPEQLKTLISPILCTTKEEQERFYQIFDRSWKQVEAVGGMEIEANENPVFSPVKTRITPWALLASVLVLCSLWSIGNWAGLNTHKGIPIASHTFSTTVGDPEKSLQIDSLVEKSQTSDGRKFKVDPLSKFSVINEEGHSGIRLDTQGNRIYYCGLQEGSDTVWLRAHPHGWHRTQIWRHQIVFSVYPPPDTTKKEVLPDTALYAQRPIPHPRDLTELETPQPTARQQFLLDWEWALKIAAILLAGLLVWFAARLWERNRRKLIAEHRPNQKPPYTWNIQLENPPTVDLGERFHRLLNQLRRREADENWRLDVPRTVSATVAKGGVPQFRYARQTRPSEYLLLIDRHSPRNHQAQLFDLLARGFRSQEVLLERFWYNGDPRLCWNETFPAGLDPRSLHYHYPQSRVILFGDAEQLLNQESGRLSKWATQTFSAWQDRAVLSPKPLDTWGRRENALQEVFHVLPVSLSALEVVIERFEFDIEKDTELDPRRFPDAAQAQIQLIDNDLIKTLQHYFPNSTQPITNLPAEAILPDKSRQAGTKEGNQLPTWIAACAVYPELHWDMTLYLGDLLSDTSAPLLTADNIAQICRMPWFGQGEIPLEARKTLIAWLEREHPETLHQIREGIHRLLSQNPPPVDSAAHDAYAMNMALNEWLYTKDSARKKELENDILRRIAAGQAADFMVLKILEGPRSPEEFEVPENWRKHLKQKGLARTTRKSWLWAVPLWLLLGAGILAWKPEQIGCKGVVLTSMGKEWCAETLEEVLQVWETQALNTMENPDSANLKNLVDVTVKDILKSGREFQWRNQPAKDWQNRPVSGLINTTLDILDSVSIFQNLAVGFFNQGVIWRDSTLQYDTLSCGYFLRAQELNALLPDTAQLWYVREAARLCEIATPIKGIDTEIRLLGRILNAEKKPVPFADISSPGLRPVRSDESGNFTLSLPFDTKNAIRLSVSYWKDRYYRDTTVIVLPNQFDRRITIFLRPYDQISTFPPSVEAQRIMDEILAVAGTSSIIITLKAANVDNAMATTSGGTRYLFYNIAFIEKIKKDAGTKWAAYFVFAHEIAHHLNAHNFDETDPAKRKMMELQADLFAGSVLCKLGATLEETQSGLKTMKISRETAMWPPLSARVVVSANGWRQCKDGKGIPLDRDGDGVSDAEDKCPDESGPAENGGCPTYAPAIADRDGDGIPDAVDSCPDVKGTVYGCPIGTLFKEHVVIQSETMRSIAGKYRLEISALAQANGLELRETLVPGKRLLIPFDNELDSDGDGVPDEEDKCPYTKGAKENGGCTFTIYDNLEQLKARISQIKSEVLVINFWATWDKHGVEGLPYFDRLGMEYPSNQVHVLLISLDFASQSEKKFIPFLEKQKIKSEVGLMADQDLNSWMPRLDENWDGAIPYTIIYNKNGSNIGFLGKFKNYDELKELVDTALKSKKPGGNKGN